MGQCHQIYQIGVTPETLVICISFCFRFVIL